MVAAIEAKVLETVGVASISTDGVATNIDPKLTEKLEFWRNQVQRYSRTRSRTATVDLSNGHE